MRSDFFIYLDSSLKAYISIYLGSGARELQILAIFERLEYTGMGKFILSLNIAKNTAYIEKCFRLVIPIF